jgi:CBS domain-containing protein
MIPRTSVSKDEASGDKLTYIDREASVLEASKLMRKSGKTELLVTDQVDGMLLPLSIVTANDIVRRVIALDLDPAVLTTGDIAWSGLEDADPSDDDAMRILHTQLGRGEALVVMDAEGRFVGTLRPAEIPWMQTPQ